MFFKASKKGVLLVYPNFPIPRKSINHKDFFPIGLLKIGSHFINVEKNKKVSLVFGEQERKLIVQNIGIPEQIYISSLFTYWSSYFYETLSYYYKLFPNAQFNVGGIYVSLMPDNVKSRIYNKYPKIDLIIHRSLHPEAEAANIKYGPAFELMPNFSSLEYFVIHTMRGCHRKCKFCGTYRLEDEFSWDEKQFEEYFIMVKNRYKNLKKIVFYDNNFLRNKHSGKILEKIIQLRNKRKISNCESQSGFDGRLLTPKLANYIKKAGFLYPKLAWDGSISLCDVIKNQIDLLIDAGYKSKEISIFMIYNWDIPFTEMIDKLKCCYDWKVQINDCRFRPLDYEKNDGYNPQKISGQPEGDYYLHENWEDWQVRLFRKFVRKGNIMTRMEWNSRQFEQWRTKKPIFKKTGGVSSSFIDSDIESYFNKYKNKLTNQYKISYEFF